MAHAGASMTADDEERATVMTYVPAYQKERWRTHADRLGMSQSEFVRTMVQAGRRDFEIPDQGSDGDEPDENRGPHDVNETSAVFEERVLDALSSTEYRSWDDLLATLTDDIEDRLDETLQALQAADAVRYSGRHGGYALSTDGEDANER